MKDFAIGQRIKVRLKDKTEWNAEISEENTIIINPTQDFIDYYESISDTGSEFPEPIDNEYSFDEVEII